MNEARSPAGQGEAHIGKQIMLPWHKAVEIAMKSIKVRFWRSMITMSSIVLAIAFLMSIWTTTAITASLAVGPKGHIDVVKEKLAAVRGTIAGSADAATREQIEQRYPGDIAVAMGRIQDSIEEKRDAITEATSDEKKKLDDEIAELEAKLAAAKRLELLRDYLMDRRREIEGVKGKLDTILQQERVGGEEETKEGEQPGPAAAGEPAKTAQAAAGGFITDFLRQMSATDKWLAILALLVCFVGIVNAMFMTVQERFREIGTMKCLGALDGFIVKIFLIESAALGLIGTLFGIIVGLLLSSMRQFFVYGWPTFTYYPLLNVLVAGVMAALAGLVLSVLAAVFPAHRAARMEPVEAMRIEE